MRRPSPRIVLLAAACVALALVGCQSSSPASSTLVIGSLAPGAIIPVIVNPEFGVGPNHLVLTVLDANNVPIASPDRHASLVLTPPAAGQPATQAPVVFEWGITGSVGFYIS